MSLFGGLSRAVRSVAHAVKPVAGVAARAVAAYYTAGASEALYQKYQQQKAQAAAVARQADDAADYFPPPQTTPYVGQFPMAQNFRWGAFGRDVLQNVPVIGGVANVAVGAAVGDYSDDDDGNGNGNGDDYDEGDDDESDVEEY